MAYSNSRLNKNASFWASQTLRKSAKLSKESSYYKFSPLISWRQELSTCCIEGVAMTLPHRRSTPSAIIRDRLLPSWKQMVSLSVPSPKPSGTRQSGSSKTPKLSSFHWRIRNTSISSKNWATSLSSVAQNQDLLLARKRNLRSRAKQVSQRKKKTWRNWPST